MYELSIGVVSALIAAGIAILQFVLPNALALILTGNLQESHSAVTWSVVSRFILSTDWPLLLRSDHTASAAVPKRIVFVTWSKPIGLILIAAAAVITPLGLYDEIAPVSSSEMVQFVYVRDDGIFGSATQARSGRGYNFSRTCSGKDELSYLGSELCPGDPYQGNFTTTKILNQTVNDTLSLYVIPSSISPTLINTFQSGLENAPLSLSNFFDVEFREWSLYRGEEIEPGGGLLQRNYSFQTSLLLNRKVELVEGLIADTISGGIGFRNHSVPPTNGYEFGCEWEEDILWMQPESVCVNTNISMTYPSKSSKMTRGITPDPGQLLDDGGFVDIRKSDPYFPMGDTPEDVTKLLSENTIFSNGQAHPRLFERVDYLAWATNVLSMDYLNFTDPLTNRSRISSTLGLKYNTSIHPITGSPDAGTFRTGSIGGTDYLPIVDPPSAAEWNATTNSYYDAFGQYTGGSSLNPHNITSDMFEAVAKLVAGKKLQDAIDIDQLDVRFGWLSGPTLIADLNKRINASSSVTWYKRPILMCVGATRVSLKTVKFRYNATKAHSLEKLEILDIGDKLYDKDDDLPIWGLETPQSNNTTWSTSIMNPLWGLIDPSLADNSNITTLRSDHFYIPAGAETSRKWGLDPDAYFYSDYVPATSGPAAAWASVFRLEYTLPGLNDDQEDQKVISFITDSLKTLQGASNMLNLLWTNFAINSMTGTRGIHTPGYNGSQQSGLPSSTRKKRSSGTTVQNPQTGLYPIHVLQRQTRYKWLYAIPAFICVFLVFAALILAAAGTLSGRAGPSRLRYFMYSISAGRLFAELLDAEAEAEMRTEKEPQKTWDRKRGRNQLRIRMAKKRREIMRRRGGESRKQREEGEEEIRLWETERWIREVGWREVRLYQHHGDHVDEETEQKEEQNSDLLVDRAVNEVEIAEVSSPLIASDESTAATNASRRSSTRVGTASTPWIDDGGSS